MQFNSLVIAAILGLATALPGTAPAPPSTTLTLPPTWTAPSPTPGWTNPADCGAECGGFCGDYMVESKNQASQGLCVNDIGPEECDLGPVLNGAYNSGCSSDCKWCGYCGDGWVNHEAGEECDNGWQLNGTPGNPCSANCTWCPPPTNVTCTCPCGTTETGDNQADCLAKCPPPTNVTCTCPCGTTETGDNQADCLAKCPPPTNVTCTCPCGTTETGDNQADCLAKCPPTNTTSCETCNPISGLNFCDITTSCITTPSTNDYCACRAGYRATGLAPSSPQQFRLAFPGQEYRVFVAPGVVCDTLCTNPFPGPLSCQEVPVQDTC